MSSTLFGSSSRLTGRQQTLLALAVVVVLVLVLSSPDTIASLLLISALFIAFNALTSHSAPPQPPPPPPPAPRERFSYWDERASPPYAAAAGSRPAAGPAPSRQYPGSIDADEYDSEAIYGHRDRTEGDNGVAPEGNPYNPSRVGAEAAAAACLDDEANDTELDGDERATYQARSRNDADRQIAGLMNRRRVMKDYLEEELVTAEEERWWGRHEV